jgi:hypothetical protein
MDNNTTMARSNCILFDDSWALVRLRNDCPQVKKLQESNELWRTSGQPVTGLDSSRALLEYSNNIQHTNMLTIQVFLFFFDISELLQKMKHF